MREILATCVLEDVDRESMWGAVCDLERYDEFVPYVVASEVAARRRRGRARTCARPWRAIGRTPSS